MLSKFKTFLARTPATKPRAIPAGDRVYAIGDIHGRIDLFQDLISLIEQDDAARGPARTTVVLLGDLIDRGPDSAAVVTRAREWGQTRTVEYILGNHEEMLLTSRKKADAMRGFLRYGGRETILSYGIDIDAQADDTDGLEQLQALMNAAIPQDDIDFIKSFKKMIRIGDYLFVHAGIHPDAQIEDQLGRDCRWIREPFLSHKGDFGVCVIHGHTITEEPDVRHNRIGIDTGSYLLGTLTAIGLEGTDRWFLQANDQDAARETSVAA